jgi:hypothetical protein
MAGVWCTMSANRIIRKSFLCDNKFILICCTNSDILLNIRPIMKNPMHFLESVLVT